MQIDTLVHSMYILIGILVVLYINDFRYMNWYTKSKSTIIQPQSLDAKQLRRKEIRSQSIPHNLRRNSVTHLPEVNLPSPFEDDTESGKKNKANFFLLGNLF